MLGSSRIFVKRGRIGGKTLATLSTTEPQFQEVLETCVLALRRMAEYELEEPIQRRLLDLSEKKEFLDEEEHDELMALVDFWQKRTNERLEAQVALKRLGELLPDMVPTK
jgi:hypothetical protein